MDLHRGFRYYLPLGEVGIAFFWNSGWGFFGIWNFNFWNLTSYACIEVVYFFLSSCFRRARRSALSTAAAIQILTS